MSIDDGHYTVSRKYTEVFSPLLEEDSINAYQLSQEKNIEEYEADVMLDFLERQGYIEQVSSDGGEQYATEDFNIENHQEILNHFNLV